MKIRKLEYDQLTDPSMQHSNVLMESGGHESICNNIEKNRINKIMILHYLQKYDSNDDERCSWCPKKGCRIGAIILVKPRVI